MKKSLTHLKLKIPDFENFSKFLIENKRIIHTGDLAEYYCELLFELKLNKKGEKGFDAINSQGKNVEIKQRKQFGASMRVNLDKFDYLLYVDLDENLLPRKIFKYDKNRLKLLKDGRVSFKDSFHEEWY